MVDTVRSSNVSNLRKPSLPSQPTKLQSALSEIVSIKVVFSVTVFLMAACLAVVISLLATTSISSAKELREKYVGYIIESKINDIESQLELPRVLARTFVGQSINKNIMAALEQGPDKLDRALQDFADVAFDYVARLPYMSSVKLSAAGLGVGVAVQSDLITIYKITPTSYSLKLGSRNVYLSEGTYPGGQFLPQSIGGSNPDAARIAAFEQGKREHMSGISLADKTPVLFARFEYSQLIANSTGGYRGALTIGYGFDFMKHSAEDIEEIDGDRVLIIDANGAIIASSEGDGPFIRGSQYTEVWPLIHASEWSRSYSMNHTKKWIRDASQVGMSTGNGELTIDGKTYVIYTRRLTDPVMPGYLIVAIPSDFALEASDRAITKASVIAASTAIFVMAVVLVMAVGLLRAIANLTHAVDQSAGLNFQQIDIRLTKIKELSVLQDRFQHMSGILQQVSRYIPEATLNVYRRTGPIEELPEAPIESGLPEATYSVSNIKKVERRGSGASSGTHTSSIGRMQSQHLAVLYIDVAEKSLAKHDQLYLSKYSEFLVGVGKAIAERGGVLDIVHEEGLIVTFNAFLPNSDPVVNAGRAAWSISKLCGKDFAVYIGLSSGTEFVKGELGSESLRRMTTVGLVPRLARTLSRIAREASLAIVCCGHSSLKLDNAFYIAGCDRVKVGTRQGKASGITLYTLIYSKDVTDDEWMYKLQSDTLNTACGELNRMVADGSKKQPVSMNNENLKNLSNSLPHRASEQFSAASAYVSRVCSENATGRTLAIYRAALLGSTAIDESMCHDDVEIVQ